MIPLCLVSSAFRLSFWRSEGFRLFDYRSPESAWKKLRQMRQKRWGSRSWTPALRISFLALLHQECGALLQAYFPPFFSCVAKRSQTGWASFLLLHGMHCKYGFMRSVGEWKGQMAGGVLQGFFWNFSLAVEWWRGRGEGRERVLASGVMRLEGGLQN
jgi:hypothetical protein